MAKGKKCANTIKLFVKLKAKSGMVIAPRDAQ
jgi:hypothetical protein